MAKRVSRKEPNEEPVGLDALKYLAGHSLEAVHLGARGIQSRVVQIQRDAAGNVVGSIERIEETLYTDLDANWRK